MLLRRAHGSCVERSPFQELEVSQAVELSQLRLAYKAFLE
jgi:hypothetical protein